MIDSIRHFLSIGLPKQKWQLAVLLCLGGLAGLSEGSGFVLLSILIGHFTAADVPGHSSSGSALSLAMILALYAILAVALALLVWMRVVIAGHLRYRAVESLRRRLLAALLRMDWSALQRLNGPDVTHLLTAETAKLGIGIDFLLNITAIVARLPVLFVVAIALSPLYASGLAAAFALFGLIAFLYDRSIRRSGESLLAAGRRMQVSVAEIVAGRRIVKGMNLEEVQLGRFSAAARDMQEAQVAQTNRIATSQAVAAIAGASLVVVGLSVAVLGLNTPLADALVSTLAFVRLGQSGMRIHDAWGTILLSLPSEAAIRQMLEEASRHQEPIALNAAVTLPRDAIRLRGIQVSRNDGHSHLTLPDADIPIGKITVITGPSGSGKSTLADIVMGLLMPDEGALLLDDAEVVPGALREWRSRVGYLPQDAFLFNESIRQNLTYGCPTATEADMWAALEKADIADRVRQLPLRMETVVGEGGGSLSGGERQRIALARALLRKPALLVLDEPTSALDAVTEGRILQVLQRLRGELTVLAVAHRPTLISIADHVIVLTEGEGNRMPNVTSH